MTATDISQKSTHDLWIDARQFSISISRPSPTTIQLTITRPTTMAVADGALVLLSDLPINAINYPEDGTIYNPSTDWLTPSPTNGQIPALDGAHVVGFYSNIQELPFPTPTATSTSLNESGTAEAYQSFTITVTNTNPNTIYYASVHGCSNVLQYYPIGVSSYPLQGELTEGRNTNLASAFTGNIPVYDSAPLSPSPGSVYFDKQLNLVQYFDGVSGSWIPTRSDSIVSGAYNPGVLGQVYLYGGGQLKVFNGKKWVDMTPSNTQLRQGVTWVPLTRFSATTTPPQLPVLGEMYYDYTLQRIQYWDGSMWVFPNSTNTLFNTGAQVVPAFVTPLTIEPQLLSDPYIGQLFYNLTTRTLNAWNGVSWNQVNTDQQGSPSYDKIAIGDDGSYAARLQMIKVCQSQLGWPQQCVELKEEQFNIALDNALANYRQLSSGAYTRRFIIYKLIPGQQQYYLNNKADRTDSIVDIHKIHRMGPLGIYGGGPNDVWAQAFAQRYYDMAAGGGDLLSTQLVAMYSEELQRMFAGELMFQWDEPTRELYITRAVRGYETVIIEAMLERSEQEIINDRWSNQYIQNWAMAELKYMLGMIRSKFTSGTPGAAGSINLNGELLISEARQDMTELKEELLNYEYGGQVGLGNTAFLIG